MRIQSKKLLPLFLCTTLFFSVGCTGLSQDSSSNSSSVPTPPPTTLSAYWSDNNQIIGLHNDGGDMLLGGKKYNAAGLNVYDLITSYYRTNNFDECYQMLETMSEKKVPVIRFNLMGHSHKDVSIFLQNLDTILAELPKICARAQELQVGLIPSFFWLYHGLPDCFLEPVRAWLDKDSQTYKKAAEITQKIVTAVKDYKSIWMWEFGNEWNLNADLRHEQWLPPKADEDAPDRTVAEDTFSSQDYGKILSDWATQVNALDNHGRLIGCGSAVARSAQYNLYTNLKWTTDTLEQKEQIYDLVYGNNNVSISEHLYHIDDNFPDYMLMENNQPIRLSYKEYITMMKNISDKRNRVYYIGEYLYMSMMGPEYGMAKVLDSMYQGENKALIFKSAAGGSALSDRSLDDAGNPQYYGNWYPRSLWEAGYTPNITSTTTDATGVQYALFLDNFTKVYTELKEKGYTPVVKGMAWMQGEADIGVSNYDALLKTFITDLRTDLVAITEDDSLMTMPFAVGKIARSFDMWESSGAIAINELQQKAADELDDHVRTVETEDLIIVNADGTVNGSDRWHFNANDSCTLGERFADTLRTIDIEDTVVSAGRQIRLGEPTGLRFMFKLSDADYQALIGYYGVENVGFGAVLLPTDLVQGALTKQSEGVLDCPCVRWYQMAPERVYTAVLTNIPAESYGREISVRPYVKVTVGDKTTYYYGTVVTASISEIANMALADVVTESDAKYQYPVTVNGQTKYSPYNEEERADLNKFLQE